jgi:aminopeptidase N
MALTQKRAEERGQHIREGSVRYNFSLYLEKGEGYSGYAEIVFELARVPPQLLLDFKGQTVLRVVQQGQQVEVRLADGFLHLDAGRLAEGTNSVGVHYANRYDNDGSGCVSFVDVDAKQYLYTQFEPYYACRVFPCFDQPDLKARMRLGVIAPNDWQKVLSNEHALLEKELRPQEFLETGHYLFPQEATAFLQGKQGKMTIFPEGELLPTYLYCVIAGEYVELELPKEKRYRVDLCLFRTSPCRSTASGRCSSPSRPWRPSSSK